MPMPDLTERQAAILRYIIDTTARNDYQPSVREIGKAFGIGSPNGVWCHLKALSAKGYLVLGEDRARALRVLRGPDGARVEQR